MEEWRRIPGQDEEYEASSQGRIRSWKLQGPTKRRRAEPKILKEWEDPQGYRHVTLVKNSKVTRYSVHTLVAKTFLGPSEGRMVLHGDGNPSNNRVSNLRWGTAKENQGDRVLHGTQIVGTEHHSSKLSPDDVALARKLYVKGSTEYGSVALARRFGVHQSSMYAAIHGHTWTNVKDTD